MEVTLLWVVPLLIYMGILILYLLFLELAHEDNSEIIVIDDIGSCAYNRLRDR
jgi:hypothetical protein